VAEKLEALWLVFGADMRWASVSPSCKLFRSRAAARKYAADKRAKSKVRTYEVHRVTWGPEQ